MPTARLLTLTSVVLIAAASRLIPHPPNFTPIIAIALFSGATFPGRRTAFIIPLLAMLISDWVIGFHSLQWLVYGTFVLITAFGLILRHHYNAINTALAGIACSVLFFVISNAGVWAFGSLYPRTLEGLTACFIAAIPFFQNTLLSTLLYSGVLFGGYKIMDRLVLSPQPLRVR